MPDQHRLPNLRRLGALCAFAFLGVLALPGAAHALPPGFQDNVVISGLDTPTSVRFSSDGRVFVAEKRGLIRVYSSLSDPTPTTFADLRNRVYDFGDRGLLGLELHPGFPSQPFVYALYSLDAPIGGTPPDWNDDCPDPPGGNTDGCVGAGRLSRLTAAGDVMTGSEQVLIEDWCIQFITHSVGDLEFGPDGALYVSGGDGAGYLGPDWGQMGDPENPCGDPPGGVGGDQTPPSAEGGALRSQDLRTPSDPTGLDGTILRVHPDTGAALPDNPLAASTDANARRILAYGARNPFRFAFRPGTSEIWFGDVGMEDWEEINRLQNPIAAPVENFGWPCREGSFRQPVYDSADLTLCESLYAAGGATDPYFAYNHDDRVVPGESCPPGGSSTSGVVFYPGGDYPDAYDGALFFADYSRSCIWAMPTNGGALPDPDARLTFEAGAQGPVDLEIGPGGDIYYPNIAAGEIHRIEYQAGNQPPTALATADPTSGPAPLQVDFDASGSSDPEDDPLSFAWDLDNDGAFDDSTSATPQRTYSDAGNHEITLRVRDPSGGTDFDSVTITAGGSPPTATIDSPDSDLAWAVGERIDYSGSATDAQDGMLDETRLDWQIDLHHCATPTNCHTHPWSNADGVSGGHFFTLDHSYPAYLTIRLIATDSDGLTDSDEVRLDPRTAQLSLGSAPAGLQVGLDGNVAASPVDATVIAGSHHTVSAPSPQQLGGAAYAFSGWSDAGLQTHEITVPDDMALTAQFAQTTGGPAQTPGTAAQPPAAASTQFSAFPPNTVIRHGPKKRTRDSTPTFRFRSLPSGAGAGFTCRLDRGDWVPCGSPYTLGPLDPGRHVFRARSFGPTALVDRSPAKRRFKVLAPRLARRG